MNPNRVLVYHKIDPKPELGLTCIHPGQFRKQIEFLIKNGFRFVTLSELAKLKNPDNKTIAITFDDGYKDVYEFAFPVLSQYSIPATVFIITDYIGKRNDWDANLGWIHYEHLNEDEIRFLQKAGWEIGSHSVSHKSIHGMTENEIIYQLTCSKEILEDKFAQRIDFYSPPFGSISNRIRTLALRSGYKGICGFYSFKYYKNQLLPGIVPRLAVYRTDTIGSVRRKLLSDSNLFKEVLKQNIINFCSNATIMVNTLR